MRVVRTGDGVGRAWCFLALSARVPLAGETAILMPIAARLVACICGDVFRVDCIAYCCAGLDCT